MNVPAIETVAAAAAALWIPGAVERYFAANLIPLPSWPYGIALALFAFFLVKTVSMWVRRAVRSRMSAGSVPGQGGAL